MATTKNFLDPTPKPSGTLVGINLTTAGHLADALARVARELDGHARDAASAAAVAGLVPVAAGRLRAVAGWADGEAVALRALIERLRRLDGGGVTRWTGGADVAFAAPLAAHRLAQRVVDAVLARRLTEARGLLAEAGDDPVVATVLVEGLGAEGIVALLRPAREQWAGATPSAAAQRRVVAQVGAALARAGRHGTSALEMDDLVDEAERTGAPLAALALLFVGGDRFPATFTREAVRTVVAPLNRLVRTQPGLGVDPWLIPAAGAPLDARVLVLRAAARDHRAAVEAVGAVDLDDLLAGSVAYLDGGVALAGALLAATTPRDHRGAAWHGPLVTGSPVSPGREGDNARRVIEWIGAHRDVPFGVHLELGRLARPWIGSFRTAGLDRVVQRHLDLDEDLARSYLTYASARDDVGEQLREEAWRWAAAEIHRLSGPAFTGGGFDAVGSVLGIVTVTGLDAEAARAAGQDTRVRRQSALWQWAGRLVLGRLPVPVRPVVAPVLTRALPDGGQELEHWRDLRDLAVVHEYLALDYLAAGTLWARRADNGYLVAVPPREILVDPDRPRLGLRPPHQLDEAGVRAWTEWRATLADGGPAPLQAAGDQFLADSRS